MKKRIRLTESQLHNVIRRCVNEACCEGTTSQSDMNKWDDIRDLIGDDAMISELYNFLSCDDIADFIEHIDRNYDLGLDRDEDDFEDDDDDF